MARIRSIKPELWVRDKDVWPHGCCLYLIEEGHLGPVKVGIAEHPIRRLGILQCGNPRQLYLRAIFAGDRAECKWIEGAILLKFSGSLFRGEWIAASLADVLLEIRPFEEEDA